MKAFAAKSCHVVAYDDLVALLRKHEGKVSAIEMLAIAANVVGKLAALQNQRGVTSEIAKEVIAQNILAGNRQALEQLSKPAGST